MELESIPDDTKLTLLLCAVFGAQADRGIKPLTLTEFNRVDSWLESSNISYSEFLSSAGIELLQRSKLIEEEKNRVQALLKRGASLAFALERWTANGLWVICRQEQGYPQRMRSLLGKSAPPIIFGTGNSGFLEDGGLAIVGSRAVKDEGHDFTNRMAVRSASQQIQVISGGARGVDREAMEAALDEGGNVVGVLAGNLLKAARSNRYRERIKNRNLTLISVVNPDSGFSVGSAMSRNKYIYVLSDWALVISATLGKGGTWAGATENLRNRWVPLFVWSNGADQPGNKELIDKGAYPLNSSEILKEGVQVSEWLDLKSSGFNQKDPEQLTFL